MDKSIRLAVMAVVAVSMAVAVVIAFTGCADSGDSEEIGPSVSLDVRCSDIECLDSPILAFEYFFTAMPEPLCEYFEGSGAFGSWIVDSDGRPAYRYEIDPDSDIRAEYETSRGISTDHWHQIGNTSLTATAHNRGHVEIYDMGRGPKVLNGWDPDRANYSGGFHWIRESGRVWCTHWSELPQDAFQERIFGIDYAERRTLYNDLLITERVRAPHDPAGTHDDPVLISETEILNLSNCTRELALYEYWDFNLEQLLILPLSQGLASDIFLKLRDMLNRRFRLSGTLDPAGTLRIEASTWDPVPLPPDHKGFIDWHPNTMFLSSLDDKADAAYADQVAFFGGLEMQVPEAVCVDGPDLLLDEISAYGGQAMLGSRRNIEVGPQESLRTDYLLGYAHDEEVDELVRRYRESIADPDPNRLSAEADFISPRHGFLRREMIWHAAQLIQGSYYQEYFDSRIVSQGSAYLYVQGFDGAHRDFGLFVLPLVYIDPGLARDILIYMLRSQDAQTGALPYGHLGFAETSGMLVHSASSDLDLFLFLAMAEYLGATRDLEFLNEPVLFYPLEAGEEGTVLEHLRAALDHLTDDVGFGRHGLLRIGTGDWNDSVITYSPNPLSTMRNGESFFNTALAAFTLPRLADALEQASSEFALELRALAGECAFSLQQEYNGFWMPRAYIGNGEMMGLDRIFLDTQPWVLLSGVLPEADAAALAGLIHEAVDVRSPVGIPSLDSPFDSPYLEPWMDTNGGTWAAIDSWMVWAYAAIDPEWAYDLWIRSTLAAHAETYPETWFGIWSGPDSYNAHWADDPGGTFSHSFTDMRDFPVMNQNRHSGPLLGLVRLSGIDAAGGEIVIDPALPFGEFRTKLNLIGVAYVEHGAKGYYRPIVQGEFRFCIRVPRGIDMQRAMLWVNSAPVQAQPIDGFFQFSAPGSPGDEITWEIGEN